MTGWIRISVIPLEPSIDAYPRIFPLIKTGKMEPVGKSASRGFRSYNETKRQLKLLRSKRININLYETAYLECFSFSVLIVGGTYLISYSSRTSIQVTLLAVLNAVRYNLD